MKLALLITFDIIMLPLLLVHIDYFFALSACAVWTIVVRPLYELGRWIFHRVEYYFK